MKANQAATLRRRIERHKKAAVALSWQGFEDPDDGEVLIEEARLAAEELEAYIQHLITG